MIDIIEFILSGKLGPIGIGDTPDFVRKKIGEPDLHEPAKKSFPERLPQTKTNSLNVFPLLYLLRTSPLSSEFKNSFSHSFISSSVNLIFSLYLEPL